jgi:hypothetical protein
MTSALNHTSYFAGIIQNVSANSFYYSLQTLDEGKFCFINFKDSLEDMAKHVAEEFGRDFREKITYKRPSWNYISAKDIGHLRTYLLSPMEIKLFEKDVSERLKKIDRGIERIYEPGKIDYKFRNLNGLPGFLFSIESAEIVSDGMEKGIENEIKKEELFLGLKSVSGKGIWYNYKLRGDEIFRKFMAEFGTADADSLVGKKVVGFINPGGKNLHGLGVLH